MKWYVGGPMSGIPQFNFPAFFRAREDLQAMGFDVLLPCDMDDPDAVAAAMASDGSPGTSKETWGQCLALDVALIADHCQGIILLPGWQKSRGARLECFTGLTLGPEFRFKEYSFDGEPIDVERGYVTQQLFNNTVDLVSLIDHTKRRSQQVGDARAVIDHYSNTVSLELAMNHALHPDRLSEADVVKCDLLECALTLDNVLMELGR